MKKRIRLIAGFISTLALTSIVFVSPLVLAQGPVQSGADAAHGSGQPSNIFGDEGVFTTITDLLLYTVGILSVIMLIIGGLRYVLSAGNPTTVAAAKNTILYAIVGLIVAILAYAIIHFVINAVSGGGSGGTNV